MIELDVRGLSCPEPVLALQRAIFENQKETIKVLASEAHTVKNIVNFAESHGKKAVSSEVGEEYEILVEE